MASLLYRARLAALVVSAAGLVACSSSNEKSGSTKSTSTENDGGGKEDDVKLADCDGTKESSSNVITQACGTFITPTGTSVQLGPYGASMDTNVGKGFENPDPMDSAMCPGFANLFMEDPAQTTQLLDVGTQPCTEDTPNTGTCLNMQLYSVYRPAKWPDGKIPVLTWGNGTCAQPEGYGTLLRYIASYGFFVVAANSREVATGADLKKALDFVSAANDDSSSPYYGHLDMTRVGAMGHSQGCAAAALAAQSDDRITSAILYNGSDALMDGKSFLAISGELDVTGFTAAKMEADMKATSSPAAYMFYHNPAGRMQDTIRGHLVLMLTPDRVAPQSVAWWQMIFNKDDKATAKFVGDSCEFCTSSSDFDYGQQNLPPK